MPSLTLPEVYEPVDRTVGCESLHLLMFAPRESAVSNTLLQLCSVPQVTRGDDNSPTCPQPPIHSKQRQCLRGGKLGRRTDDEPGVDNMTVTYKCLQMSASRFVRLRKEVLWNLQASVPNETWLEQYFCELIVDGVTSTSSFITYSTIPPNMVVPLGIRHGRGAA